MMNNSCVGAGNIAQRLWAQGVQLKVLDRKEYKPPPHSVFIVETRNRNKGSQDPSSHALHGSCRPELKFSNLDPALALFSLSSLKLPITEFYTPGCTVLTHGQQTQIGR
jgi:hypothetical protein